MCRPEASFRSCDPAGGDGVVVLRAGDGLAVLARCGASVGAERDRIASRALNAAAGAWDIEIERRPSGRPRLAPPYPELGVSLSHRDGNLAAAFSATRNVGVDIEVDSPGIDPVTLARDHFSSAEAARIRSLAPHEARDAFLRCWVAKEAALKLSGRGIFDGMREPDLSGVLDRLRSDAVVIELEAWVSSPGLLLTTCQTTVDGKTIYGALAVAA